MSQIEVNDMCFACGSENPIGLHLRFEAAGPGRVSCAFTPEDNHQGWKGTVHGGLVATLLDEAMAWAVLSSGTKAVTAKMEVRWRIPVPVGEVLRLEGEVVSSKGRAVEAKSALYLRDGRLGAEARGVFMCVDGMEEST